MSDLATLFRIIADQIEANNGAIPDDLIAKLKVRSEKPQPIKRKASANDKALSKAAIKRYARQIVKDFFYGT